jgi:hypothetical protein
MVAPYRQLAGMADSSSEAPSLGKGTARAKGSISSHFAPFEVTSPGPEHAES